MVEVARELTHARIRISPNEIMSRSYYDTPPKVPENIDIRAITKKLKNRINKRNSRASSHSSSEYSFTLSRKIRASLTRLSERLNKTSSETISDLIDRAEKNQKILHTEEIIARKTKNNIEKKALLDTWSHLYTALWEISKHEYLNNLSPRDPSLEELKEIQTIFENSANKLKSKFIDQRLARIIPETPNFGERYSQKPSID